MKKIAGKIAKRLGKAQSNKVVDLSSYRQSKQEAETLFSQIKTTEQNIQNGRDPLHAVYTHAQNLLSVLTECLQEIPEPSLTRFWDVFAKADEDYMPGGPPMSPLTTSYFNCWLLFDLAIGLDKETLTTIVLDLSHLLGLNQQMVEVMQAMQQSRMGIYEFMGRNHDRVLLKEIGQEDIIECLCPAGYQGNRLGELWFARVLPPLFGMFNYSMVFTTPYVLQQTDKNDWVAYLQRTVTGKKSKTTASNLDQLMKYGLSPCYWHEYIFESYLDARTDVIFLTGLPDIAASRPHARDTGKFNTLLPEKTRNL